MFSRKVLVPVAVLAAVGLLASGCETATGSAVAGGATGAGIGAIIGNQSGSRTEGALIGGLVGALAGTAVHDYKKRKSAEETAKDYEYQPAQGEMLRMEDAAVLPSQVRRGNKAEATIQYALLGAGANGTMVRETRSIRQGDRVVSDITSESRSRTDGTWVSTTQFDVPRDMPAGTYTMMQTVETSQSRVSQSSQFTVTE